MDPLAYNPWADSLPRNTLGHTHGETRNSVRVHSETATHSFSIIDGMVSALPHYSRPMELEALTELLVESNPGMDIHEAVALATILHERVWIHWKSIPGVEDTPPPQPWYARHVTTKVLASRRSSTAKPQKSQASPSHLRDPSFKPTLPLPPLPPAPQILPLPLPKPASAPVPPRLRPTDHALDLEKEVSSSDADAEVDLLFREFWDGPGKGVKERRRKQLEQGAIGLLKSVSGLEWKVRLRDCLRMAIHHALQRAVDHYHAHRRVSRKDGLSNRIVAKEGEIEQVDKWREHEVSIWMNTSIPTRTRRQQLEHLAHTRTATQLGSDTTYTPSRYNEMFFAMLHEVILEYEDRTASKTNDILLGSKIQTFSSTGLQDTKVVSSPFESITRRALRRVASLSKTQSLDQACTSWRCRPGKCDLATCQGSQFAATIISESPYRRFARQALAALSGKSSCLSG
ncbi:hypothetical protein BDN72DRAFT_907131 [Pluteus cervinus]|uniref:Uncharacterized protein n=1 Tax=Pluteus cervinus TaxID=181527 RepID=A0ACD2ZXC2_9AGAR|nr:hypothetical protein BDN72DRAFT_907131 [Pluteus cervinus]